MAAKYGYSNADWSLYKTFRPTYPRSLFDLIFSYHRDHHPYFDAAHDVGSGAGIVAGELGHHFAQVFVSDSSEHNISSAREKLLAMPGASAGQFTFSATPGEHAWLPPASVDLVTICEALHWMHADAAVAQAARALKPGGTLALVYYCPRPVLCDNPRAELAFQRIMDLYAEFMHAEKPDSPGATLAHVQGDVGLDFAPISTELFEPGAKRLYINTHKRDTRWKYSKSDRAIEEGWFRPAESKIGAHDLKESVQDDAWAMEVEGGTKWFKGLLSSLQQGLDVEGDKLKIHWEEMEDAIREEAKEGRTKIVFVAAVVLATRKFDTT